MDILGIHTGHNATACLLRDGRLVAAASEERFSRRKNFVGVPERAVRYCLDGFGVDRDRLAEVAVAGTMPSFALFAVRPGSARGEGWLRLAKRAASALERAATVVRPVNDALVAAIIPRRERALARRVDIDVAAQLRLPVGRFERFDHHRAHAATAYYGLGAKAETLVFTADGGGDLTSATVSVGSAGELSEIARTSDGASLGGVYTAVTEHLGMKPVEDEHKVMGLAPYARGPAIHRLAARLNAFLWLNPETLVFESRARTYYTLNALRPYLAGYRFDVVAAAVQKFLELRVTEWVRAAIRRTGIRRIAAAGGVFLNVKLNRRIAAMPEVESFAVFPSGGDESIAIGAAYLAFRAKTHTNPEPIGDVYLGPEFSDPEMDEAMKRAGARERYRVERPSSVEDAVGELLARGAIVARFAGRMEWGARALGNRSILANPKDRDAVRTLNEQIKGRDFWMPFAPSVAAERADDYVVNPRKIPAPYMVMAFDSTPRAKKEIPATMHPYDFTLRPQIVTEDSNARYHALLKAFERRTGIGAVLNTSFNLHGEPIVCTPDDALSTFERSGLRHLALGKFLISKK